MYVEEKLRAEIVTEALEQSGEAISPPRDGRRAGQDRGVSIRMAREAFPISQTCYRYVAKTDAENGQIADWLLRLTDHHRNWGFGLLSVPAQCRGFACNHKRVYRI
jgi:putative transposase